jgi:hypothetical protein
MYYIYICMYVYIYMHHCMHVTARRGQKPEARSQIISYLHLATTINVTIHQKKKQLMLLVAHHSLSFYNPID